MFDLYEELTKIEILLSKEIEVYKILLEDEEKKVNSIINTRLQDIHLYCEHQNDKMNEANELRKMRENIIDIIIYCVLYAFILLKILHLQIPLDVFNITGYLIIRNDYEVILFLISSIILFVISFIILKKYYKNKEEVVCYSERQNA